MDKLYNPIEKEEFLNTMDNEDVQRVYYYLFYKSAISEKIYKKDLYEFSLQQLEDVMRNINPATKNSATNSKSRITQYILWAIQNGRRTSNINPLHGTGTEWEEKFIDRTVKTHFSNLEIYELTEEFYNAQDRALVQCIFEGILGKAYSELLSLRESNIDWDNNEVLVTDSRDGKSRKVKLSDRCMKLLYDAYKEKEYFSEINETERELISYKDYIFKNTRWRASLHDRATAQTLSKRMTVIKKVYELEVFRAKNIQESGQIYMAYKLCKNKGYIDKDDFDKIGDYFNTPKMTSGNYSYYKTGDFKRHINSESLKNLYDLDCEVR